MQPAKPNLQDMGPFWRPVLFAALAGIFPGAGAAQPAPARALVIPIHGEIAEPTLYLVRRGLKEAEKDHEAVILDVNTPGGAVSVTFDIMEALAQFQGQSIAYVDDEAMSAGAIVSSAAQQIWFAPRGVMGAAAPVGGAGEDIGPTMKEKVVSYLEARVRADSEGKGYRAQVISAMIDPDAELKIGSDVIKAKGAGLLSLTAQEAMKTYGTPPRPLLAAGIADSVQSVADRALGASHVAIVPLEITGAERAAVWLNDAAPILLGLGLFSLFVAFKLSHFGVFGVAGIVLLGLVFFGSSIAGLSGHEPLAVFCLGAVLVALELIFWHSAGFLGAGGVGLMLLALIWSMADLWPGEPIPAAWDAHAFTRPLWNAGLGFALAFVLAAIALRYLPSGWFLDRLTVRSTVSGRAQQSSAPLELASQLDALVGRQGVAATPLRPGGIVQVAGQRFEASVEIGAIDAGTPVVVRGRRDFSLLVEPLSHDG